MTLKTKTSFFLFGIIFIVGLFLRLYRLNVDSPSLYADEMGHYFTLGALRSHELNPVQSLVGFIFTSTWFLGLNPLGFRFSSAIFSSLIVIVGFFFAKTVSQLSGSKFYLRVALVFALLCAVIPWNIAIARIGHTHVPLVVLLSLWHLTVYLNSKNWKSKIISFVPFLVSCYFYPTLIIMSPFILLLPAKELLWDSAINKKYLFAFIFIFLVSVSYLLINKYQVYNRSSRGLDLAIWNDTNVTADSNLYRGAARLSAPSVFSFGVEPEKIANKLVFNYPVSVASVFTKNYLSFFSTDFLFLKGDGVLRHSIGMVGNFYVFLLPFMAYGAFVFFRDQTTKNKIIFATWIIASPLPAAFTKDGATYLLRAITLMPFLTYFCSLGIVTVYELFKSGFLKIIYTLILFLVALFSIYYYFYGYFHVYPSLSASSFEYGFKELAIFQKTSPGKMLVIWEDKYPFAYFCFWQNLPYSACRPDKTETRVVLGGSRVDFPIPELLFSLPQSDLDLEQIISVQKPKFLALPGKYKEMFFYLSENYTIVSIVKNPDLTTAFEIYEI